MTALQRVRTWAEDNGHEIKIERRPPEDRADPKTDGPVPGEWRLSMSLEESILFEATSGWQETVEAAARVLVEQLIAVGEDVPE